MCLPIHNPTPGPENLRHPFTTAVNETRFCLHHFERYESHPKGTHIHGALTREHSNCLLKFSKFL